MAQTTVNNPVYLGIDIGGTGSRWVACDLDGRERARGRANGATAHVFNETERARLIKALGDIADQADRESFEVLGVRAGITGYGAAASQAIDTLFASAFSAPAVVMDDISAAYHAVFDPGEGHLVSAGTGSFGVHVAENGTQTRIGGRGLLIDDAGSGGWISLRALDCLYRHHDRDGTFAAAPRLAHHIFQLIEGSSWDDIRQFVYSGDRGRIGTLALAVSRAAEDEDATSIDILRRAGMELAALAQTLIHRAGPRPVAFVGGATHLHPIQETTIRGELPLAQVSFPRVDAAFALAKASKENNLGGRLAPRWAIAKA